MEINDRCEDYGMKINITKTKAMVIGRKPKKIDVRIKDESVEQVDSFKYFVKFLRVYNINSIISLRINRFSG